MFRRNKMNRVICLFVLVTIIFYASLLLLQPQWKQRQLFVVSVPNNPYYEATSKLYQDNFLAKLPAFSKVPLDILKFKRQAINSSILLTFSNYAYVENGVLHNFLCWYSNLNFPKRFAGLVVIATDHHTYKAMRSLKVPVYYNAIFWRATKSTILRNNSLPRTTEAYHSFIVRRTILIDRIRRETGLNVIHCDADVVLFRSPFSYLHSILRKLPRCDAIWSADLPRSNMNFAVSASFKYLNGGFYLVRSNRLPLDKLFENLIQIELSKPESKEQPSLRKALGQQVLNSQVLSF